MELLKVLALLTRLPIPPWRGDQVRAYHHLRLLARRHEITVCALVLARPTPDDVAAVRAFGMRVDVVPLGLAPAAVALAAGLLDATPLQVHLFRRARALAHVRALLARERFDVGARSHCGRAPLAGGTAPAVVLTRRRVPRTSARRAARERGPLAVWGSRSGGSAATSTRSSIAAATLVVAEPERALVGGARVQVVPNGVDLERFPFVADGRIAGRIVFAGNLGYFPNVDAACWLVEEILPAVRARVPGATVHLVGARPSARVRALATRPGVSLAADVAAMAPEIATGTVTIIPMRSGSGLQNKVLEAMAVGTPVVTTPQVVAALAARDGEHLLVGSTAEELAAAAAALLASRRAHETSPEQRTRWSREPTDGTRRRRRWKRPGSMPPAGHDACDGALR